MRLRLEFDIDDNVVGSLRSMLQSPVFGVQIRAGIGYVEIGNCVLTVPLPHLTDTEEATVNSVYMTAILDTLTDLGNRYGCGGTSDHELVSDVLHNIRNGIQQRLEKK